MAAPKRRLSYYVGRRKILAHTERDERIRNNNHQLMNGSRHVADVGRDLWGTAAAASFPQKNEEAAVHMLGQCDFSRECQRDNPSRPLSAILRELLKWRSSNSASVPHLPDHCACNIWTKSDVNIKL